MARILSVLPHAGGNVAPTLEILGELARRGADVTVLGHAQLADAVEGAGFRFRSFKHARAWSATVESPGWRSLAGYLPLASDRGVGRDLAEAAKVAPDLVMVDCMLPGALRAARATGAPVVMVMHAMISYWESQWSRRAPLGLWLRATGTLPGRGKRTPDLAILCTMPELDPIPPVTRIPRAIIAQTGPLVGRVSPVVSASPDSRPTILISLSTISYPGQDDVLQRLVDAVSGLPVQAIVTTGPALDPATIVAPANVDIRRFVPHEQLLPTVQLVIGHGGHGTTMRALAHGVPVVVVPMSSVADHHLVADAVVAARAGARLPKTASREEFQRVIADTLADSSIQAGARRIADLLHGRSAAGAAADAVEELLDGFVTNPPSRSSR
jgi:UDP:flavonoid glycosyltransferase YjiC (YdhE family)